MTFMNGQAAGIWKETCGNIYR